MRDLASALFWLAVSILICTEAFKAGVGGFRQPGAGFLPLLSGVILGAFSIILMILKVVSKNRGEKKGHLWKGLAWGNVVVVTVSLLVYAALLPLLGYVIATFGLMFLLYGRLGSTRIWVQATSAFLTAVGTYLIFSGWLDVPLPKGVFGF